MSIKEPHVNLYPRWLFFWFLFKTYLWAFGSCLKIKMVSKTCIQLSAALCTYTQMRESMNITCKVVVAVLYLIGFCERVAFLICSSSWAAPLPPVRKDHDEAWRPTVNINPLVTGSFLSVFSCLPNFLSHFMNVEHISLLSSHYC